jgi:hypothetical protein
VEARLANGGRRWRAAAAAVLIVGAAVAYWQWRVIAPVRLPQDVTRWNGDLFTIYVPLHAFAYDSSALLPPWNPYQLAGVPFLATYNGGLLYPLNFLSSVLPVQRALGYGCAIHLALAGSGAFLCARALSLSLPASLLAGVMFMLNGRFLFSHIHPSYLAGHAWIPLVFLAAGRMAAVPGLRTGAVLGTVLGMQLLTGHPQIVCYTAYCLLVATVAYAVASGCWSAAALLRLLGAAAGAAATALLLAAAQLVPTAELVLRGARSALTLAQTMPDTPSPRLLAEMLLSSGPGVVLVVAAFFDRGRRALVASGAALAAFAVLVSLGTVVYTKVFYHLPGVDHFRVPNRMYLFGALTLALLAASGLDVARAAGGWRMRTRVGLAAVLSIAGMAAHLVGARPPRATPALLAAIALLPLLPTRAVTIGAFGVVALAIGERFAQPGNPLMLPQHNADAFFAPPPYVQFLKVHAGFDRTVLMKSWSRRFFMMEKRGTLDRLSVAQDYEPLVPAAYHDFLAPLDDYNVDAPLFWGRFYPPPTHPGWKLLDMMAVRYVAVDAGAAWRPASADRFAPIYEDGAVRIYENRLALPRAYLVARPEVVPDAEAALARVRAAGFEPRSAVVVDRPPDWRSVAEERPLAEAARITALSPGEVVVHASARHPAVLVLADLHWPGWRVAVDGEERPLLRANFLFRGVALGPGTHTVRFWYDPPSLKLGIGLTLLTAAALLGLTLRRSHANSSAPRDA